MNLGLLEASPQDAEQVSQLFDANEIIHQQVYGAIQALGVTLNPYPMSVVYPPDVMWTEAHAAEHSLWAQILNIDNPGDLNQYDMTNPRQFEQWINIHVQHHQLVADALGLL